MLHPALLGKLLERCFLLGREVLGNLDVDLDVLIATPSIPLDPLPRDAEPLTVLCAGRHLEHDALPVERPHLDFRAEQRLREVDRHDADDVQPLAPEEPIGLDLDHDHHVPPSLRPLPRETEPRAVLRAGGGGDRPPPLAAPPPPPPAGGARRAPPPPPPPPPPARPRGREAARAG